VEKNKKYQCFKEYYKLSTNLICFVLLVIIFALDIYQIDLSTKRINNFNWNHNDKSLNIFIIIFLILSVSTILIKFFVTIFYFNSPKVTIFSLSAICITFYLSISIAGLRWFKLYHGDDDDLYLDVKRSLVIVWFNTITFFYFLIVSLIHVVFFLD